MQTYAPIALFTYNRADHTQRAVESLLQNAEAKNPTSLSSPTEQRTRRR